MDAFKEGGPFWAGKNADGSFTATVNYHFSADDIVALRGEYLMELDQAEESGVAVDWGDEMAVVRRLGEIVSGWREWKGSGLTRAETQIRLGSASSVIPPDQLKN